MDNGTKLRLLHLKESVIDFFNMLFGLHIATYAIVGFMLLISLLVAFNTPKGKPSYIHASIVSIRTSSNTIETNAGGFVSASAKVVLENGVHTHITINKPPLPKVGDRIKIAKFKRVFNGTKLLYVGSTSNEN